MEGSEFKAVVWDMDGLLFDTERLSFLAWREGADAIGMAIDEALFRDLIGRNRVGIQARLREVLGADTDVETLTRQAGVAYTRLLEGGPPLKAGAKECLTLLFDLGVPQAVATSTSQRLAEWKLAHHGLLSLLNALVTGDQVTRGKPDPEPFRLAAQRLGVEPANCFAFEDSVNGIQSAHEAGMYTILVPDLAQHDDAAMARVCRVFRSLEDALPFLRERFSA